MVIFLIAKVFKKHQKMKRKESHGVEYCHPSSKSVNFRILYEWRFVKQRVFIFSFKAQIEFLYYTIFFLNKKKKHENR